MVLRPFGVVIGRDDDVANKCASGRPHDLRNVEPLFEDAGTSQDEENWVSRGLVLQRARSAQNTLGSPA